MGLSRAVSETNGDFNRKSQIFQPRVFNPPLKGFLLQMSIGAKCKNDRLPGRERILTISFAICMQYTNVTDRRTDGQTDGRTPADSKDRAYG